MIPEGNPRQRPWREDQVLLHVDIAIFSAQKARKEATPTYAKSPFSAMLNVLPDMVRFSCFENLLCQVEVVLFGRLFFFLLDALALAPESVMTETLRGRAPKRAQGMRAERFELPTF